MRIAFFLLNLRRLMDVGFQDKCFSFQKIYTNMMPTTNLHFELPKSLTVEKFIDKISKTKDLQIASRQFLQKTFYDSFDWRLYNAELICEFNQSKTASYFSLVDRKSGCTIALTEMGVVPEFADQFPKSILKSRLKPILEMRALIALSTLSYQAHRLNIINKDQKTTLRLNIEEYELLPNRITLQPIKGYDKAVAKMSMFLEKTLELKVSNKSVLNASLKLQGRKPKDYSSKQKIQLDPEMRSDQACKKIYRHLLWVIKINEAGTIADIDSEFLHDYRVAIRKTRSGLSQLKLVFPGSVIVKQAAFFAWMGSITSHTRDMDVYMLAFEQYKESLPVSIREDLNPLYQYLEVKQKKAQQALAKKLLSNDYIKQLAEWEKFLQEPVADYITETNAKLPIKQFANKRIWKIYSRVLKEGERINDNSPGKSLHELRKTCKKLRYLMEFFQTLYPEEKIIALIKKLKKFQEVLGDFQDYEVQEETLIKFSEEMMANNISAATFLAMGVLVQNLESLRKKARNDFNSRFADFTQADNRTAFETLFATKHN